MKRKWSLAVLTVLFTVCFMQISEARWIRRTPIPPEIYYTAVTRMGDHWLIAGHDGIIVETADFQAWAVTHHEEPLSFQDVCVFGNRAILATYEGSLVAWDGNGFSTLFEDPDISFRSIDTSGSVVVAVGAGGVILTSADGSDWQRIEAGEAEDLLRVRYLNGLWLACGSGGALLQATDPQHWTIVETGTTEQLIAMAYGEDTWLVYGSYQTLTSGDGLTWQLQEDPHESAWIGPQPHRDIEFYNGYWYAAHESGGVLSSTDMVDWPTIEYDVISPTNDVEFADNTAIAVGSRLILYIEDLSLYASGRISPLDWNMAYSEDMVNGHFIGKGPDGLVATGKGNSVLHSEDGINWSAAPLGKLWTFNDVHYSSRLGNWFLPGSSMRVIYSGDAVTWNWLDMFPDKKGNLESVAESPDTIVVCGYELGSKVSDARYRNFVFHSTDGVNWEVEISESNEASFDNIHYEGGQWIISPRLYNVEEPYLLVSSDLKEWEQRPTGFPGHVDDLVYFNDHWYAVGDYGGFYRSADLVDWVSVHPIPEVRARDVYLMDGYILLTTSQPLPGSGDNLVWVSRNGTDWVQKEETCFTDIRCITEYNGLTIAIGRRGILTNNELGASPWPGPAGPKWTSLGWIDDSRLPHVWSWAMGTWYYLPEFVVDLDNLFLYCHSGGWIWHSDSIPLWCWSFSDGQWQHLE